MGGQSINYSYVGYFATDVRIWIDAKRAVPLFIRTSAKLSALPTVSTWRFTDGFYELENGLAPRAFEWTDSSAFHERQEFQVVNGVWIFSKGRATHRAPLPGGRLVDRFRALNYHSQELELIRFRCREPARTHDQNSWANERESAVSLPTQIAITRRLAPITVR